MVRSGVEMALRTQTTSSFEYPAATAPVITAVIIYSSCLKFADWYFSLQAINDVILPVTILDVLRELTRVSAILLVSATHAM
jgi:hypothetical protein